MVLMGAQVNDHEMVDIIGVSDSTCYASAQKAFGSIDPIKLLSSDIKFETNGVQIFEEVISQLNLSLREKFHLPIQVRRSRNLC